jgi:hypothetical protein
MTNSSEDARVLLIVLHRFYQCKIMYCKLKRPVCFLMPKRQPAVDFISSFFLILRAELVLTHRYRPIHPCPMNERHICNISRLCQWDRILCRLCSIVSCRVFQTGNPSVNNKNKRKMIFEILRLSRVSPA